MQLRPAAAADVAAVMEIDGTVESYRYLHVEQAGEGLEVRWSVQDRPLRERLILSRPMDDEQQFALRQIAAGIEDGLAVVAEHDGEAWGLLVARPDVAAGVMRVSDLRVDFDHRREGLATAMMYAAVAVAREEGRRAIAVDTPANNGPAHALLLKLGFVLTGMDTQRWSSHDLVKEAVTLFWYLPLD